MTKASKQAEKTAATEETKPAPKADGYKVGDRVRILDSFPGYHNELAVVRTVGDGTLSCELVDRSPAVWFQSIAFSDVERAE